MKKVLPILLLLSCFGTKAAAQHYQKIVNELTACSTLSCIDSVKQQYKPLKSVKPELKHLGLDASRWLLDFEITQGNKKEKTIRKSFRLSMFVLNNNIEYGQLEQLNEEGQLETTYLFENNTATLEKHVESYNSLHQTNHSYLDLIGSITTRKPIFWIWIR